MMSESSGRAFRLACAQEQIDQVLELLMAEGFESMPEPFSPYCRRLIHEPFALGSSLGAYFGYIYIQDKSSMLPPLALSPARGDSCLDMCASPGGKASFLAQLTGPDGFTLANEPNLARLGVLRANLGQMNLLQCGTSAYAGERLPLKTGSWTHILLDAPCSGWGTEKRHPRIRQIWQGAGIRRLVSLQRQLLAHAAALLAPGGRLVYSTCTTTREEDEEQTKFAEKELGLVRKPLTPFPGFVFEERPGGEGCLLVAGEESGAQGFYISLLTKPGKMEEVENCSGHGCARAHIRAVNGESWPEEARQYGDDVRWIPQASACLLPDSFRWQGALIGKIKRGGLRFDSRLKNAVFWPELGCNPIVMKDIASIRKLLSGWDMKTDHPDGQTLLCWRSLPLGVVTVRSKRIIVNFR